MTLGPAVDPSANGPSAVQPPTILVVEDEPALLDALEYSLARQGYRVRTAVDGVQALESARRFGPAVIVLDVMLPRMDGLEVCRILRAESDVGILMLTARAEELDRVVGLEVGADDYLTKPFSMRELMARVKALLRRSRTQPAANASPPLAGPPGTLTVGDITIDEARHEVRRAGEEVHLTPREYDLFLFMAHNRGMVLRRELILERVWGWEFAGDTNTVDVHIHWLRSKLENDPGRPAIFQTVTGVGYRLD